MLGMRTHTYPSSTCTEVISDGILDLCAHVYDARERVWVGLNAHLSIINSRSVRVWAYKSVCVHSLHVILEAPGNAMRLIVLHYIVLVCCTAHCYH